MLFGLVTFNIANDLTEGGVTGITLILSTYFILTQHIRHY